MTNDEIANKIADDIERSVFMVYGNDPIKCSKVIAAMTDVAQLIQNKYKNSVEALEALILLGAAMEKMIKEITESIKSQK